MEDYDRYLNVSRILAINEVVMTPNHRIKVNWKSIMVMSKDVYDDGVVYDCDLYVYYGLVANI